MHGALLRAVVGGLVANALIRAIERWWRRRHPRPEPPA